MRTSRTRSTVLAAATAVLALGLTACGGTGTAGGEGAPKPAAGDTATAGGGTASGAGTSASGTSATGGSADAASASRTGQGQSQGKQAAGQSGKSGQGTAGKGTDGGAAAPAACGAADLRVTAEKQDGVPTTHIVLTAKNVSGRSCTLLQYPLIAFGEIQTAKDVPSVAKSRPHTPVVLRPGAPAYAAVRINQGGVHEDNRVVKTFYVNVFAADGPAEGSKSVTIGGGGIAVDDAAAKTGFWTEELRNGADDF
ncbi:DUF4232 domain-containing protein [Streptomyces sp. NPDC001941]|uniref:DUF4232 domain-containing protein n=1 Tax=Streptomyces sp. NPDC001941 TaxID=3154659 RepID=UPI00332A2F02